MSASAVAATDIIAAPSRAPTPRAPDDPAQSFYSHLAAADSEAETDAPESAALGEEVEQPESEQPKAEDSAASAPPQPHAPQTHTPLVLQIVNATNVSAEQPASAETTLDADVIDASKPEAAAKGDQSAAPMASNTPEKTSNAKPGDAAFDKLAAAAAAPVSDAARQIQTQTAQAPPQTPQVKPEAAPVEQTTQANLATPSLAQPAPIPRAETPRIGKNAAKTPDLRSADASEAKAFEQAVMQKSAPQPTAPVSQNKDAPAFTALISADAPAPALSQAPATTAPTALQTTQSQHIAAERVAAHAPPATAQVAREIVRRFDGANTRFELRLDPPELGRIEVRLDVSRDHRVTAVVAAESPQALAELVRHARELEQALQSAGLELADNGLSFDLRQSEREFVDSLDSQGGRASAETEEQTTTTTAVARPIGYERWRGVRLDMRV